MGGKAIAIEYGTATEYVEDGGQVKSAIETDIMEMATSELDYLKSKIEEVVGGLTKTLDNVNTLLSQNTDNLTNIVANVDGVTSSVNSMLKKEKEHLEVALSSLSRFSQSLGDNAEDIDTIINNMSKFSSQLAESRLVEEVEGVVTQLNAVLASVNDKSGSVGKMLSDDELYNNLTSASNNLSTLLDDLKQNPHRYINVSVFGSNPTKKAEKAKAKAEKKAIKRADEIAEREAEIKLKSLEAEAKR
jgi:phospholipid/cholesterol/gamma-HCH transport system substrate-binding protein